MQKFGRGPQKEALRPGPKTSLHGSAHRRLIYRLFHLKRNPNYSSICKLW
jgi:hypothetical protein